MAVVLTAITFTAFHNVVLLGHVPKVDFRAAHALKMGRVPNIRNDI